MDDREQVERLKRLQKELEEQERRDREQEEYRAQIRKRILDEAERKKARRDEKRIRAELKAEGLLPVSRRIFFRSEPRENRTEIEARGICGIQLRIYSRNGPQIRRLFGVSLIRSMKPILRYLRDFDIRHEGEMLSIPRLEERGLPLDRSPDRASVNSRHLSEIELGLARARPRTLRKIKAALATMLSHESE